MSASSQATTVLSVGSRMAKAPGQLWLNVASSHYALPDFTNLDNHPFLGVSKWPLAIQKLLFRRHLALLQNYQAAHSATELVRHDCRRRLPFADGSADHILCSHFLEHVYPREAETIIRDFHRVLKPGGTLHVIVPDLEADIVEYLRERDAGSRDAADAFLLRTTLSTEDRGSLRFRILEALGGFGLQHRWMYDRRSIEVRVAEAGFRIAEIETPSSLFRAGDGSVHVTAVKEGVPLQVSEVELTSA